MKDYLLKEPIVSAMNYADLTRMRRDLSARLNWLEDVLRGELNPTQNLMWKQTIRIMAAVDNELDARDFADVRSCYSDHQGGA